MRNSKTLEFMNNILKESENIIYSSVEDAKQKLGDNWPTYPNSEEGKYLPIPTREEYELYWAGRKDRDMYADISYEGFLNSLVDSGVLTDEALYNILLNESEKLTEARNPENDEANELIRTSLNDPEYAKTHTAELRKHGIKYLKPNKDWGDNGALEGKQGRRLAINTDPKWSKNNVDYNTGRYMNDDAVYKKDYSREDTYADQKDLRQKGYVDSKEEYNKAKNNIKRQRTKVSNMEKKDKEAGINWNEKTSKARDTLKHYENVLKKGIEPNYKNTKKIHPDTDLKGFLNAKKHSDRELPLEKQPDYNKGRNKTVTQFNNLKAEKNYLDHERERNKEEDKKDQERIEYYKQRAAEDKARRDEYLANNEKEWKKGQDELNQKLINYRKRMENK